MSCTDKSKIGSVVFSCRDFQGKYLPLMYVYINGILIIALSAIQATTIMLTQTILHPFSCKEEFVKK